MKKRLHGFLTLFLALVVQLSFAQVSSVTGTVTDEGGMSVPGVNVIVKGTNTGAQTDFDGKYSVPAASGDVLVFSYVGFQTQEMVVGANKTINVTLAVDAAQLDEVIVTALGIERKPRELSYAVASLDNEELTETRALNTATALSGKVSGLQVNTIGNGVNPNTRVVLRGNRSLLGNNEALIVVDGYPTTRGVLDRINPEDIAKTTVLKGANAAALYGSEAANGVIIITTKKGKGKLNVTLTTSFQLEDIAYYPELQDEFGAGGFPDGTLYPLENVNWGPRFDGSLVEASETYEDGRVLMVPFSPIKNNHENFFNTGTTIRNSVTVGGGDEDSDFLLSLDHSNVEGVVPNDQYNRTNARFKASRKFDKLTVGGNLSFFRSHSNTVTRGGHQERDLMFYLLNTPLHIPLADLKDWRSGEFARNEVSYYRFYENPYFILDSQRRKEDVTEFTFIANANYDFTDWLSARVNVGYTNYGTSRKDELGGLTYALHAPDPYSEIAPFGPATEDNMYDLNRVNSDFIVSADKQLSDKFHVSANVGHNLRLQYTKEIEVGGTNLIIPDFYNVSTRTGNLTGEETQEEYRKVGVYGDFTLGFDDYLFLTGSGRNDWSSALNKDNRSYFYPSGGISFIPTTAFEGLQGTLRYLKASFSASKTGNDPDPYQTRSTFFAPDGSQGYGSFPYGSTAGLALSSTERDPNLKPEFTTSLEAGVEFAFFRGDRLSGGVTAYKSNSTDQLVEIETSQASGARSLFTNIGEIENLGLEVDLRGKVIRSTDFSWDLGVNYSTIKSEVLSLKEGVDEIEIGGAFLDNTGYGVAIVAQVGEPYPLIKTTDYERDAQGRVIVGDDGDPITNPNLTAQGKTTPDYIVGLNTKISYKNFTLYAVADYRTGHVFYNSIVDALEFTGLTQHSASSGRQPFVFPNSVYDDGTGNLVANGNRLTTGGGNDFWDAYGETKSNYVTDATTVKLREVSLGYTFDQDLIDNLGLQDLSLNVYGRNLFMWRPSSNVYTDPEFNYDSGNATGFGTGAQTPPTRQYGVSLTAKF